MVETKWLASLSDGSTVIEREGLVAEIPDGLSSWQQLLKHLKENNLYITGMRIQLMRPDMPTQTYNLPSFNRTPKGNHEKWVSLWPVSPASYDYFRWITKALTDATSARHQIEIRATYPDFIISLFVDEDEGNESWVVVHK